MEDDRYFVLAIFCIWSFTTIVNALIRSYDQRRAQKVQDRLASAYEGLAVQLSLVAEMLRNEWEG